MKFLRGVALWLVCVTSLQGQIQLIPTVSHLTSPAPPGAGAISLAVSGGTAPYAFSWNQGAYTSQNIAAKPYGSYALKVTDSHGDTAVSSIGIGYKADWGALYGASFRHDSLIVAGSGYLATAVSKNSLNGGADGWFEYVLKNTWEMKYIGFLDSVSSNFNNSFDIDYGFWNNANNGYLYIIAGGNYWVIQVYPPEGTIIRVERVGDVINYRINGRIVYSIAGPSAVQKNWKLKAAASGINTSLVNVGCSFYEKGHIYFPGYLHLSSTIVHASNPSANDGSIRIDGVLYGDDTQGAYSYTWQPGSLASNAITSKPAGVYTVIAEDSLHHTSSMAYRIGYKTEWGTLYGASYRQDTLMVTGSGYLATAVSKNALPGGTDGWFEFVLKNTGEMKYIGFLDSVSGSTGVTRDIDFGFWNNSNNGYLYILANGNEFIVSFAQEGTLLGVERVGDVINFRMNGGIIYSITDAAAAKKSWKIKGALSYIYSSFINVGCSFAHQQTLHASASIQNYSEASSGEIRLQVSGGAPNYDVQWNGMKLPSNHDYYVLLDSASAGPVDTLVLYPKLDSLRRSTVLKPAMSAIYNNIVVDQAADTLKMTTFVGTDFGWIGSGVTTNSCVIPSSTVSGIALSYGQGQSVARNTSGSGIGYALSDKVIHPKEREFYIQFAIANDTGRVAIGLSAADSLHADTLPDMARNTMVYYVGKRNYVQIYYDGALQANVDYLAGDNIGILLDPVNHKLVYYKNTVPVWTKTNVSDAFFAADYQLKALLSKPLSQLGSVILVGQVLQIRQISGTVTDVTCGAQSSGGITFNASTRLVGEYICSYSVSGPVGYTSSGSGNSAVLTGLYAGTYTVNAQIRAGSCLGPVYTTISQTFDVCYMPDWINQKPFGSTNVNVSDRSFNVTATQASPYSWLCGASTENMLGAGDGGYAEFKPLLNGSSLGVPYALAFGLNDQDQNTLTSDIDHRFYVTQTPGLQTYGIGGGSSSSVGPYAASLFSAAQIGAVFYTAPSDVLKVKKVSLSGGLSMKLEFYKNNALLGSSPVYPSIDLIADISVNQKDIHISKPRVSFGCDNQVPYYFILRKNLDAGYYNSFRKSIYFTFEEEYYDASANLSYAIVDDMNQAITAIPSRVQVIGDNRYAIDLSTVSGIQLGKFYRIAIKNQKNEIFYARFKY